MTVVTLDVDLIVRKLRTRKEHNQEANLVNQTISILCASQTKLTDQPMTAVSFKGEP